MSTNSVSPVAEERDYDQDQEIPIESLEGNDITSSDINNLKEAGFYTVKSVAFTLKKVLMKIKGISEGKADKIILEAYKLVPMGFKIATEMYKARANIVYITTGSAELDRLLGGGVKCGAITEIIGDSNTGKTQLCHTLAVNCQLPVSMGGAEARSIYIDTMNNYDYKKIVAVAKRYQISRDSVFKHLTHLRSSDTDCQIQMEQLLEANRMMSKSRYRLLVEDVPIALCRRHYEENYKLPAEPKHLENFLEILRQLAKKFNCAVVITNQVKAASVLIGDQKEPIGGSSIYHPSTTRLYLRGSGKIKIGKIYKSPSLPEGEARFAIQEDGIGDIKE